MAQQMQSLCRLISTVYVSPEGEMRITYGVELYADGQVAIFPDVALSVAAVESLLARLRGPDIEPIHWRDIVIDYIQELSMG